MTRDRVRTRWAHAPDRAAAHPLFQGILRHENAPAMPPERFARLWRLQSRRDAPFRFVVALDGPRVVGLMSLHRHWSTFAVAPVVSVEDLYVAPRDRGRGVATTLLGFGEAHARRLGAVRLELHVRRGGRAGGLYRRLGFRPTVHEWWHRPLGPMRSSVAASCPARA